MNQRIRMLAVWSAAAFFVTWLLGFVVFAGWFPPTPPSTGAQEMADLFRSQSVSIRICMVFMTVGAVFYLPFTMLLSDLIKEIERPSALLAGTQLAAGILCTLTFFIPAYIWTAAAFRPERNPEITQALTDLAWLLFMTGLGPFALQYVSLAIAIFIDKKPVPTFPRWAGYVNVFVTISFLPAPSAFFFKTGPFSWNGLFIWWLPLVTFAIWFISMIYLARKAVLRQA